MLKSSFAPTFWSFKKCVRFAIDIPVQAFFFHEKVAVRQDIALNNPKCGACGKEMKRNGTTSAGAQRWRCKVCGASSTHKIDNSAKQLKNFLKWLMGKLSIKEYAKCSKATFERRVNKFWNLWPLSYYTGEVHDVIFVDGLYITKNLVVLIASTKEHVLAWHLAESESSESWAALMLKIAPPIMVVTDGGTGFKKAAKIIWPEKKYNDALFM